MEFFARILSPYATTLGNVAGIVTALQFFSGFALINDIRKNGSSKGFPALPFLIGGVLSTILVKFATIVGDDAMFKSNLFGFGLNIIFICIYQLYTPNEEKTSVWAQTGLAGLIAAGLVGYTEYEDPKLVEMRVGMVITVILVILVGSPLLSIPEIVRTKSTGNLPFPMISSGAAVQLSWLVYGLSIRNEVMVAQNLLLFLLSAILLTLFVIYPSKTPITRSEKKKQ